MYQKIHKHLTFLFTGITSLILVLMSAGCLYIYEKAMLKNSFLSFSDEMNTIVSNLEQQTVISHEWLANVCRNGRYTIAVYDNGVPLTYTNTAVSPKNLSVINEVRQNYAGIASSAPAMPSSTFFASQHKEFTYTSSQNGRYYVCFAQIQPTGNPMVVVLHSTKQLSRQLMMSRICVLALNLAGVVLLLLFSWHYTRQLLAPVQKAQEGQAAFIAAASHELRTPLCVILSSISACKCAPPAQKARFLAVIETESRLMSRLVTDLLTLSRADSHTWNFHMKETELDTVLLDACETFRPIAAKKQISLSVDFTEDLFPSCFCDEERILQVFGILISNAVSYGRTGGYIKLRLAFQNGMFIFQAEDNGAGISKEAKEHIFERFYRADSSRSQKEHLGLGLCIAEEIIKAHHGSIGVSDAPGGGTVFTVRLPGRRI